MSTNPGISKTTARPTGGVAAIASLDLVSATLEQLSSRRTGVTGIGVLYGPSGWGKTFATNVLANEHRAYYVQMRSAWRSKDLLRKILVEMGVKEGRGTTSGLLDMVAAQLSESRRTLIIDEFDYAANSDTLIELTRDIYEASQGSLLLVGEEQLPRKLEKPEWERLHNRVSAWAQMQAVSLEDADKLAQIYCPGINLTEEVLAKLVAQSKGAVRRVVNCLNAIYEHGQLYAMDTVDAEILAGIRLPSGRAPERRV
jgi:DNA transposition AAA+ family ATPase